MSKLTDLQLLAASFRVARQLKLSTTSAMVLCKIAERNELSIDELYMYACSGALPTVSRAAIYSACRNLESRGFLTMFKLPSDTGRGACNNYRLSVYGQSKINDFINGL